MTEMSWVCMAVVTKEAGPKGAGFFVFGGKPNDFVVRRQNVPR